MSEHIIIVKPNAYIAFRGSEGVMKQTLKKTRQLNIIQLGFIWSNNEKTYRILKDQTHEIRNDGKE